MFADDDDPEVLNAKLQEVENKNMTAKSWQDEAVLNELLAAEDSESDNDEDNKRHADGTRDKNLILWEAADWRQKIYAVFESGSFPSDMSSTAELFAFVIAAVMVIVILLSCLTVVVESYPEYVYNPTPDWVSISEVICVVIFTYDLILRFITCPYKTEFVLDILNWIDLVAIAPFYLEQIASVRSVAELRILRVLRLARIVRVFRLFNISKIPGMAAILGSIQHSFPGIFLFLCIGIVSLITTSTAMFYAERGSRDAQGVWIRCDKWLSDENCTRSIAEGGKGPSGGQVSPFQSIIDAFWWSFNTMSTVGLGDVYPVTSLGEFINCLTMLLAVFILALPTMILTGNFDVYKKQSNRILTVSWVKLAEQQRKLRRSDLESPRTQIIRKMGWNDDEPADFDEMPDDNKPGDDKSKNEIDMKAVMAGTMSLREAAKARSRLRRKRRAERVGRPMGCVQFGGQPVEIYRRQGRPNIHRYFYDPLFRVALCEDGVPVITIIRGRCGMPTVARLQIELDHPNLRRAVLGLVENIDPSGTVQCDLGGGFEILHFASSRAATDDGVPAWQMRPVNICANFRNSDCPVYFTWTQSDDILDTLNDDEVAEMALSHLVGSSFHIRAILPVPPVLRRIAVEQQIIHHTRFQRELTVIAKQASDDDPEFFAYVTKATLQEMLEGVSQKIIIEPTSKFEDPRKVDREVGDRLMSRLREMKLSQVPANCKDAVYDYHLLSIDDIVVEVPMSLFDADADDEVDEDALGYIDCRMVSVQARCLRVDIKTEFDVVDP